MLLSDHYLFRGDDENGRLIYEGGWLNKAAHGQGVMRWQNGDRYISTVQSNDGYGTVARGSCAGRQQMATGKNVQCSHIVKSVMW